MTIHHTFIGCDIGKDMIDIFDPRTARFCRIPNEQTALSAFARGLDPATDLAVFEATGHCDRLLRLCLSQAGIAFARVNPKTARRFAEARGRLAKTDRIDARSLCEMGTMFGLTAEAPPCPVRERLAALARRRDQLVDARATEHRHLCDAFDPAVRADIEAMIAILGERIASIQAAIDEQMKNGHLAQQAHRLTSAPGVGKVTALTLLAHMPELGSLSPKTAASLAGLAPFNDDSGRRSGRRRIKDGRPRVRKALYMAASARSRPQRACAPFIRPSQPEQAPQRPASSPSQESSSRSSMQCSATKLTSLEHSCHVPTPRGGWSGQARP